MVHGTIQCPRCGESLPAGTSRCDACGAFLVAMPGVEGAAPRAKPGGPASGQSRSAPAKQSGIPSAAWSMLLIGLICGGAVGYALRGSVGPRSNEGMPSGPADILAGQTGAGDGGSMGGMGGGAPAGRPTEMPAEVREMIAGYKATLAKDPDNVEANIGLGNLLFDSSQWERAIEHYQRALAKSPRNADVRVDMAICYHNLGQDDLAKKELERVTREQATHMNAWLNLGVVSANSGDRATAIRAWEQYLKLDPNGQHAGAIRQQIEALKQGS